MSKSAPPPPSGEGISPRLEECDSRTREILRALGESESTAWALLNATLDSAFLMDRDGIIHAANERGAIKMGAPDARSMVGRSMGDFIPREVFERRLESIRVVFASAKPLRTEDLRAGLVFDNNLVPVFDGTGKVSKVAIFARDITQRRETEAKLRRRAFQQGVVAELGLFALGSMTPSELMRRTCRLLSTIFEVEYAEVLELSPARDRLTLVADAGWNADTPIQVGVEGTQAGLALSTNAPVVVENLLTDKRISEPGLLGRHGVASGISVVIHGTGGPYGVLGVHSTRPRGFSDDDVHTLQSVANVLSDAVERFHALKALENLSERNAAVLDSVALGIFGVDKAGHVTFANPAVERLTGYSSEELLGAHSHRLLHHTRPDGSAYPEEECPLTHTLSDGRHRHVEEDLYWRKDSTGFPVDCSIAPLSAGGAVQGAVVLFEDITERKRAQERLRRQAFFDELTGLPNRAQLKARLEASLARTPDIPRFALLFLDLDDFKVVNDGLGHDLGDRLLRSLGERLSEAAGPGRMLARTGGDEFAILIDEPYAPGLAGDVARRIHEELAAPERLDGYELFMSCSIGLVLDDRYQSVDDVLRDADTAMFKAKALGKGETAVFDTAMHAEVRARLLLENDLRRALERGEFFLVYQPIVELDGRTPAGFEALLRWRHPEHGVIPPLEFIPVAEASGLILPIGEWVISEACSQLARWREQLPRAQGLTVSVNLSGRQFIQEDLTGRISRIVGASGLPPRCVKLEITESVVMDNAERAVEMLTELKDLGISTMIDDFGTGYSSLAYLRRFPVDALKVDRAFVRNLHQDRDNLHIVKAVVQLAGSLEMDVVAEGIEGEDELKALQELGCGYGQGYHFARPLAAGAAFEYLRQAFG
ncbi:EAL domain-containing protein [Fundidesulfovibrio terrae]|uniref:EAL domain-containing protein n=1 Tax=Fundidesulfovibrio terrae TaxID=2922866 RepID=UPI001FB031EC|nr:EAL domain-containing protein [Fundidesulfovibrio terrae]